MRLRPRPTRCDAGGGGKLARENVSEIVSATCLGSETYIPYESSWGRTEQTQAPTTRRNSDPDVSLRSGWTSLAMALTILRTYSTSPCAPAGASLCSGLLAMTLNALSTSLGSLGSSGRGNSRNDRNSHTLGCTCACRWILHFGEQDVFETQETESRCLLCSATGQTRNTLHRARVPAPI